MFKRMSYNQAKEETNMSERTIDNIGNKLRVATALFLTLLLGGFYPGGGANANAQTAKKGAASSERGGQKEGIKVHGHWTVDVRNPDGKRVTHREFENALQPSPILAALLGRTATPGTWSISFQAPGSGTSPCKIQDSNGTVHPGACEIYESPIRANNLNVFNTLRVSAADVTLGFSSQTDPTLVLSGTATASFDSYIGHVSTSLLICPPDVTPNTCGARDSAGGYTMTGTSLAQPVHVVPDQIIQIKVVISFS